MDFRTFLKSYDRNLSTPLHTRELDVSAGILVPLYDPDTKMVFLAGKGDRYIHFVEVRQTNLEILSSSKHLQVSNTAPWIVEGLRYTGEQTKVSILLQSPESILF